ncbi:hypothetical protein BH10CYA1_BH10CYA1_33150 [soil metagenome]
MSIKSQPKLLLAIYALLGVLAIIFAVLLYVNPLNFESTLSSTQSANILAEAELLRERGQTAEAEKLCLNALKSMENADAIQKAKAYHGLALTYFQEKKYSEAEENYRKALACLDQLINQEGAHRLTLENLRTAEHQHAEIEGDLAQLMVTLSKYTEAEYLYKSALEKNDQYLGTMEMQRRLASKLAEVLLKVGKSNEAEEIEVEAYATDYASKDLMAEIKLVQDEFESGKIDSPKQMAELKALALTAKRKGRDVPYVDAQTALGKATLEAGDPARAKKELIPVFYFVKNAHYDKETESIWLSRARVTQAACCLALHQDQEAQRLLNEAGSVNPILLFMVLQQHLRTASMRQVGLKDYYLLITDLGEKANLESYKKRKLNTETLEQLANLYNVLGIACASFKQLDKANHYYKRSLEISQQTKNIGRQAELDTRLARIAVLQKKYDEAQHYYDQSTSLHARIMPQNAELAKLINQSISENYAELASMYNTLKNQSKAEFNYKLAYDKDKKNHNWMGIYAFAQYMHARGDYRRAHANYELALNNLKISPAPSKQYIDLMENRLKRLPVFISDANVDALVKQGNNLLIENKTDAARQVFQKAEAAAIDKFGKDSLESAQVYRDIANCYMGAHLTADAQPLYERALDIAQKNKVQFPRVNYQQFCVCLSKDKDDSKKIDNAKKTITVLSPIVSEIEVDGDALDKHFLSSAELLIGKAFAAQSMYAQAQDYFNKGVSAAEYQVTIDPRDEIKCLLADALKDRSLNQARLRRFKAAIAGYKRAIEILENVKASPPVARELSDTRILLDDTIAESKK